jgi:hypothetical protein
MTNISPNKDTDLPNPTGRVVFGKYTSLSNQDGELVGE